MAKRKYDQTRRAEQQDRTRQRIVEAMVAVHEELGPRAATVSAIAERAGVQRLTVYRHFPDDDALFAACTSHWLALNPPPDPDAWTRVAEPGARLQAALAALYGYYRRNRRMLAASYRDVDVVPALRKPMAAFDGLLDAIRDGLLEGFAAPAARRLRPVLGHALRFTTWNSLDREGLDDAAMADLLRRWVDALVRDG